MKLMIFFKKNYKAIIYATLSISMLLACIFICHNTSEVNRTVEKAISVLTAPQECGEGCLFIAKELNGKVAIIECGTGKLIEQLNVYTYSLPVSDRSMLEKGIKLYTLAELIALIEDYTG